VARRGKQQSITIVVPKEKADDPKLQRMLHDAQPTYPDLRPPRIPKKVLAKWLSYIGKLGGHATKGVTSEAKKKSSRENGKLGGRPRGTGKKSSRA
jgi:hypothetical protein